MSMKLIEIKIQVRFGLEYWAVLVNGIEHASYWSPQAAERHANRLMNKTTFNK